MKRNSEDTGYVISNTPYREYDAMILFLGEKYGLLRFVLRGYYRPTSKQMNLGLEYSKVKYRFNYRENSLLSVQNGELINVYASNREDYDWLTLMSLYSEILTRFYSPEEHSFWLNVSEDVFKGINLKKIILILSELIIKLGITPHVSSCVMSGNTIVSDFSIEKGGFVSKEYRTQNSQVTLEMLKYIRVLFTKEKIKEKIFDGFNDTFALSQLLIEYIEYHESITLNSWKLIVENGKVYENESI
ncbi:MAG TPA: DNA repair protein RecO [Erysipelothrix sp.]|nr:DNA repair protein RecO [Erysipelothrix sp.]